jgi:hypothetical protein
MEFYKKVLLIQQDLLIKYSKEIDSESLSDKLSDPSYKITISNSSIEIRMKRSFFSFGFQQFVIAKGKIKGSTINFTIQYNRLRQAQFSGITLFGIFITISGNVIFIIPTIILYLAFHASLIITRQEIIKIFERMWEQQ